MATWDKLLWQTDKYGDDKATNTASTTPKTSCLPPAQLLCYFPHMRTRSRDFCDFSDFKIFQTCPHKQKHLAAAVDILLKYTSQANSQIIPQIHKSTHPSKYTMKTLFTWHPQNISHTHFSYPQNTFLETYCHVSWLKLIVSVVFARRFLAGRRCVWGPFVPRYVWTPCPPHPALPNVWTPNSPSSVAA